MATAVGKKPWRPTDEQRAAIERIDCSMALDAAAGSGKTSVLIRRMLRIVGADPDRPGATGDWSRLERILAITFTEKAAGELRARLRPHVPMAERYRLEGAWIGTFHHFCSLMLRRHAPRLGLDPAFAIMEENAAKLESRAAVRETLLALLEAGDADASALVEAVEFRTAVGALEHLMDFRWHAEHALANAAGAERWETEALAALGSIHGKALAHYRETLARLGALDFQELEIGALRLLALPEMRRTMQAQFDHILVDEFQDTNDLQTELVLSLFDPERSRLFIVGDEAQSIYRFRGANVGCFAAARKRITAAGGEKRRLSANFRSDHGIIACVNACRRAIPEGLFASDGSGAIVPGRDLAAPGAKRFEHPVVALELDVEGNAALRRETEAQAVARFVRELTAQHNVAPGEIVLLFRALTAVAPYEGALRREGIPAIVSGGRGLLERQEVTDLMAALAFAANPADSLALVNLLRSPIVGLSDDELTLLAGEDGRSLLANAPGHPACSLVAELPRMAAHLRPSELLRHIVDLSGYEAIVDGLDPSGGMTANVDRFITVASAIERALPIPVADFAAFIGELRAQSARLGDPPAAGDMTTAVRCMSVHAAKGLEFPVVILPDLFHGEASPKDAWAFSRGGATGTKPGFAFKRRDPDRPFDRPQPTPRFEQIAGEEKREGGLESQRLLYVAMTRAMDLLVFPLHRGLEKGGPWHRWADDGLTIARREEHPPVAIVEAASLRSAQDGGKADIPARLFSLPKKFRMHERRLFTVSMLESYQSCPLRYEHAFVLGLPSRDFAMNEDDWVEKELFGLVVHGALARGSVKDAEEFTEIVRAACVANGVIPKPDFVRRAERQVKAAERLAAATPASGGFHEFAFEWRMGDATVNGSIDWLKPVDGGFEVVDFKTGVVDAARVEERARGYDLQLTAYALAAEEATGKPVVETAVVFTHPGMIVRKAMTGERRREGRATIERIVAGIGRGAFARPAKAPCESCPYHVNGTCWEDQLKRKR